MSERKSVVSENDEVPHSWVDGKIGITVQEWGQREYDSGLKAGIDSGVQRVVDYLLRMAAKEFVDGRDDNASRARELAKTIKAIDFK